ncbi:MAG: hypothetical protein AB8G96_15190 [Phycisphaerales bacterium]
MTIRISRAAGFTCVAGACVALTGTAFAGGGDDPTTASPIAGLPFADSGDTTALTNQFDAVCPFSGSTSPDSWYSYMAADGDILDIALCDSLYDTKVYVLDTNFAEVGCNDDACGGNFRSELVTPALAAGMHFIVVDGWSGEFGAYTLTIEAGEACMIECPGGSIDEGEACDDTGGVDTNGGCNSTVFAIDAVTCGDTVCGIAWAAGGTRDTDWFELAPTGFSGADSVEYTGLAGFDAAFFYLGENPECASVAVITAANTTGCGESATITEVVDSASVTWWFAGKADFDLLPCGASGPATGDYVLTWECSDEVPAVPCPELGDSNLDGFVDFNDLLNVIANFGPCP